MAIQMRRGRRADFDPAKLLPGEWAVAIDTDTKNQVVWMCFSAGVVKRMGTYEDFRQQIAEATEEIKQGYLQEFQELLEQMQGLAEEVVKNKELVITVKNTITNTYLPEMQKYLETTSANAGRAETAATEAVSSKEAAKKSENNAQAWKIQSELWAAKAQNSAISAENFCAMADEHAAESDGFAIKSESYAHGGTNSRIGESTDNGLYYKEQALSSAQTASAQAQAAASSAAAAAASQTTAAQKASLASASAATASTKAAESANSAVLSQSYAIGGTDTRTGENTDNSKYYYQQSKSIYDNFSQAGNVTGVKGNAESEYRTGNVNLTAKNIGALPYFDILEAFDANTVTRDGIYGLETIALSNFPKDSHQGVLLHVMNTQLYIPPHTYMKNCIYIRDNWGSSWSNWTLIADIYLPLSGGTVTGNLRLKGSGNYGNILNFGDGDYVHISEPTDDHLEIKGSYINFVTSNTDSGRFTLNGKDILTIDKIYPVGSIYMSVSSTNPSTLFGGTWVRWGNGRIPVGVDTSQTEFNAVEKTGGEKTHTLAESELPKISGKASFGSGSPMTGSRMRGADGVFSATGACNVDNYTTMTSLVSYNSLSMSFGGNAAHNNLQPYITCYMWKRTA